MLLILIGKSGSGKDAVMRELTAKHGFRRIVSTTTRPMRVGEQEGREYHYISKEQFLEGIARGEYLEYRSYDTLYNGIADTWFYGSPKMQLDPAENSIAILDVQGAQDFISYYGKENCCVVEISVPNTLREQRARERGSFSESEWQRRAADDDIKFAPERTENIVNARIVNTNELDRTVEEVACEYKKAKNRLESLIFAQEVDRFLNGEMKIHETITLGSTPNVLKILGSQSESVIISQSVIRNSMNDESIHMHGHSSGHNIPADTIKEISDAIRNPIAVMRGNRADTVVAITQLKNQDDKNIFVPIALDKVGNNMQVNSITSVFGKDNIERYLIGHQNNYLAVNIEKASELLADIERQLSQSASATCSANNISHSEGNVNTPNLEALTLPEDVIYYDDSIAYTISSVSQEQHQKQRIFVDMDGTLARFHDENKYLERMWEEGFFEQLKPFENAVDTVKMLAQDPSVEVFILSAAIEGEPPYCVAQKHAWLDRYLPEIDQQHRIFTAVGENKAELIPQGIRKTDVLIDDYNKNLDEWQHYGGHSIKFVNNINHKGLVGELWQGDLIHHDKPAAETVQDLKEQGVGKWQNVIKRKAESALKY
ncbi:MAG: hypothetical protein ILA17_05255 [Ruminococcus sp.]|nr:hypothetical protein [Ruminococcus sp.]